jgi:S-ribosylhomocysteine lyase
MCKWEAKRYMDRLKNDFHSEYKTLKVTLEDGKVFADA